MRDRRPSRPILSYEPRPAPRGVKSFGDFLALTGALLVAVVVLAWCAIFVVIALHGFRI